MVQGAKVDGAVERAGAFHCLIRARGFDHLMAAPPQNSPCHLTDRLFVVDARMRPRSPSMRDVGLQRPDRFRAGGDLPQGDELAFAPLEEGADEMPSM